MRALDKIADLRSALDQARREGERVGFVPTMGYLHQGHASLMRLSVQNNPITAVTIFVNPLQFGASEDLSSYPRDLERDIGLCTEVGVDYVLTPSVEEMYPEPVLTTVSVAGISARMEGVSRPTHFAGVATVVAKLFNIVGPCHAYFGEKDFQQLAVVRKLATDLSFPVEVIAGETIREPDGLAISSRNVYLSASERAAAPILHRALQAGAHRITTGERSASKVRSVMIDAVRSEPLADLEYAEAVDPESLDPLVDLVSGMAVRLLMAVRLGKPRLLDNIGVVVP